MKACPYCDSEIQSAAIKCRYCGMMLTPDALARTPPTQPTRQPQVVAHAQGANSTNDASAPPGSRPAPITTEEPEGEAVSPHEPPAPEFVKSAEAGAFPPSDPVEVSGQKTPERTPSNVLSVVGRVVFIIGGAAVVFLILVMVRGSSSSTSKEGAMSGCQGIARCQRKCLQGPVVKETLECTSRCFGSQPIDVQEKFRALNLCGKERCFLSNRGEYELCIMQKCDEELRGCGITSIGQLLYF